MKKIKYKKSEKGFAIALALLLLLVMSLMGATLVVVSSSDHRENTLKDTDQQAFYAAESGIKEARRWMETTSLSKTLSAISDPNSLLAFCNTKLFPNLDQNSIKAIGINNNVYVDRQNLSSVILNASPEEQKRLAKFQYEFFITFTPDQTGKTDPNASSLVPRKKQVTGTMGSSVAEGTSYKTGSSSMGTYYTIFSCGKGGNETIVPLEAMVVLVQ